MTFKDVVQQDKTIARNSNNAWKLQCEHFREINKGEISPDGMKEIYKELEKTAKVEHKWQPSNVYMSNKSVIMRAHRLGVTLVDGKGKLRGKSDIQKECNDLEATAKSPYEKLQAALETATKNLEKVDVSQVPASYAAIKELMKKAEAAATAVFEARKAA